MKQFVPSQVCLGCDGCCRFKEEDSLWRPRIAETEKKQVSAKPGLADKIFSKAKITDHGHLKTVACHGLYICTFFNPEHKTCGIYHARPFDCQLYPFVLTKNQDKTVVCVHLNCPYVQEKKDSPVFRDYVAYLQEFFCRQDVATFLKKNPSWVGDYTPYRQELEQVLVLNLD